MYRFAFLVAGYHDRIIDFLKPLYKMNNLECTAGLVHSSGGKQKGSDLLRMLLLLLLSELLLLKLLLL